MVTAEERKQDIINSINENPINIEIQVKVRDTVDGAWSISSRTETLTVRIVQQKSPEVIGISEVKGTADTTKKYGMLADHTAGLLDSSRETITFDSLYGKMEVLGVYPQIVRGEICGYQCDLKRVS